MKRRQINQSGSSSSSSSNDSDTVRAIYREKISRGELMELLKLSKFKLHLRALISEVRELKEREQSGSEHLHLSIEKQKKTEEEFSRKIQELQGDLASSQEFQHKLEKKVNCLQNDNVLLENKQKELKATIDTLLQSRESFLAHYEDSTSEMKRAIEVRDRKLAVLSEKILSQSSLFDMIEKEAVSVKQVLEYVQRLVSEKEDVVSGLKRKLDQISTFEKEFVEKIHSLENKLRYNKEELRRKNSVISELEGRLEAEKISNNCQPQIDEKSLSVKEETIQNLTAEKKALSFEVWSLEIILLKIQDAVTNMNEEDQKVFTSVLKGQEECAATTTSENENNRSGDMVQENREESPYEDTGQAAAELIGSPQCEEYNPAKNISQEKNNFDSCISEQLVCSPHQSASSDLQPATNVHNTPTLTNINKGTSSTPSMQLRQLDSESSTTEAEGSEEPGRV